MIAGSGQLEKIVYYLIHQLFCCMDFVVWIAASWNGREMAPSDCGTVSRHWPRDLVDRHGHSPGADAPENR